MRRLSHNLRWNRVRLANNLSFHQTLTQQPNNLGSVFSLLRLSRCGIKETRNTNDLPTNMRDMHTPHGYSAEHIEKIRKIRHQRFWHPYKMVFLGLFTLISLVFIIFSTVDYYVRKNKQKLIREKLKRRTKSALSAALGSAAATLDEEISDVARFKTGRDIGKVVRQRMNTPVPLDKRHNYNDTYNANESIRDSNTEDLQLLIRRPSLEKFYVDTLIRHKLAINLAMGVRGSGKSTLLRQSYNELCRKKNQEDVPPALANLQFMFLDFSSLSLKDAPERRKLMSEDAKKGYRHPVERIFADSWGIDLKLDEIEIPEDYDEWDLLCGALGYVIAKELTKLRQIVRTRRVVLVIDGLENIALLPIAFTKVKTFLSAFNSRGLLSGITASNLHCIPLFGAVFRGAISSSNIVLPPRLGFQDMEAVSYPFFSSDETENILEEYVNHAQKNRSNTQGNITDDDNDQECWDPDTMQRVSKVIYQQTSGYPLMVVGFAKHLNRILRSNHNDQNSGKDDDKTEEDQIKEGGLGYLSGLIMGSNVDSKSEVIRNGASNQEILRYYQRWFDDWYEQEYLGKVVAEQLQLFTIGSLMSELYHEYFIMSIRQCLKCKDLERTVGKVRGYILTDAWDETTAMEKRINEVEREFERQLSEQKKQQNESESDNQERDTQQTIDKVMKILSHTGEYANVHNESFVYGDLLGFIHPSHIWPVYNTQVPCVKEYWKHHSDKYISDLLLDGIRNYVQ